MGREGWTKASEGAAIASMESVEKRNFIVYCCFMGMKNVCRLSFFVLNRWRSVLSSESVWFGVMRIVFQINDWQAIKLTFEAPIGIWGKIDRMVRSHKISDNRDNLVEVASLFSTHPSRHARAFFTADRPHIERWNQESWQNSNGTKLQFRDSVCMPEIFSRVQGNPVVWKMNSAKFIGQRVSVGHVKTVAGNFPRRVWQFRLQKVVCNQSRVTRSRNLCNHDKRIQTSTLPSPSSALQTEIARGYLWFVESRSRINR